MLKPCLPALAIAALQLGSSAARAQGGECLFAFASQPGTPAFEAYRADKLIGRPAAPRIIGEARRYRSAITSGAAVGVNFGGRYTIVGWGCGASCLEWALVDRRTGAVRFDPQYRVVSTARVADDTSPPGANVDRTFGGLRFRRDSNMLVVQGAPNEDERREGLTFLRWSGRDFRRLAFVPARKLCS
jgi:hypothetical protein